MTKVEPFKIAIAGVGTVGGGVLEILNQKKSILFSKGINISVSAVATRKSLKNKLINHKNVVFFKSAEELVDLSDFDILVETIGGDSGVAKKIVFDAIKRGKHVVTANKALVSKYYDQLTLLADKNNCLFKYEAAVAGGIPVIKILNEFLMSNTVKKIYGILNGTCNFILTNMQKKNQSFNDVLLKAQKLGYAEANPKFDIDGTDTAQKLLILSSIAFNSTFVLYDIHTEGIQNIELIDLLYAESLGFKIKLLGLAAIKNRRVLTNVYPCLVRNDTEISNVDNVYNGVVIESDFCSKSFFQGEGAGAFPTATSVVSDIIEIFKLKDESKKNTTKKNQKITKSRIQERIGSYYLRFTTIDQPGVISGISNEFKKNKISMKSMLQKDSVMSSKGRATIVVTTHDCLEKNMMFALNKIDKLKFIQKKTVYLRIEDFEKS